MTTARWQWSDLQEFDAVELYEVLALRQRVFVVEQSCAYLDADGLDDRAVHLLGWRAGELVAYLRVLPPGLVAPQPAIGRVVVASAHRGAGLGRAVMIEGMRQARALYGPGPIRVSAQAHLQRFYEELGFVVAGPLYDEDGIEHVAMVTAE